MYHSEVLMYNIFVLVRRIEKFVVLLHKQAMQIQNKELYGFSGINKAMPTRCGKVDTDDGEARTCLMRERVQPCLT